MSFQTRSQQTSVWRAFRAVSLTNSCVWLMCSRDEQRAVPRGERPVVRIRSRTKRGVCARVSSSPELEAAGCRLMRSLYPCGAGCAQRSPDNHRTAATVIASAERIPYVAEDDSNFLSGGLSTLPRRSQGMRSSTRPRTSCGQGRPRLAGSGSSREDFLSRLSSGPYRPGGVPVQKRNLRAA